MISAMQNVTGDIERGTEPARVLVCDDSPSECAILRALLLKMNCDVVVATSGERALELLCNESFDLLLLDVEMGGLSGIEVTRILRSEQGGEAYLPVILLTARSRQSDRLEGLRAGASDFLTKPFDPAELGMRIDIHVHAKRLRDKLAATNRALEEERAKIVDVQLGLLPKQLPTDARVSFGAAYYPGGMASGDYYDVIDRGDGRFLIAIGDVSGHGIPSAMYMACLRSTLHKKAKDGAEIEGILAELNEVLRHALNDFSFVTFQLVEVDLGRMRMRLTSAGHPPPLLRTDAAGIYSEIALGPAFPLGLVEDVEAAVTEMSIQPGQRLFLYTDGLLDQTSVDEEFFGMGGVLGALRASNHLDPAESCKFMLQSLRVFSEGMQREDDVTFLMLEIH